MSARILIVFILTNFFSCGQSTHNDVRNEEISTTNISVADSSARSNNNSLIFNKCQYDNQVSSLGIGLIIAPSKLDIYNDSLLSDKKASWDMYEDGDKINLCSKFFKPDYGIMHFVCIGKTDKSYVVLVNFSDIKYLPKRKSYVFKFWEEYILQSGGLKRVKGNISENLPLRLNPNNNADTLEIPEIHGHFCPLKIKGDWVKVKYNCFYDDDNNAFEGETCHIYIDKCEDPLIGWLRWRQENKLLIDIFLIL